MANYLQIDNIPESEKISIKILSSSLPKGSIFKAKKQDFIAAVSGLAAMEKKNPYLMKKIYFGKRRDFIM
jgi:hypothetical protein